jgi:anhydro-N-acetylmuramic acid kinase
MAIAVGLMSGTSLDGVDVALIETDGTSVGRFGGRATEPYPRALRDALTALVHDPARAEHDPLAELEAELTELNARAVEQLLGREKLRVDVIGYHGQTILHRPERRYTRQLGDGAALSARLGLPVVNEFRHADVAAGGQGAPFAPLYHAALARSLDQPLAVLNLGGVGNVTYIEGETVIAFDTGPANALIDDWITLHTGALCDEDGRIAARGKVDGAALTRLMDHRYFAEAAPKSLDRNDFSPAPVAGLSLEDGAATLTEFTARSVAAALPLLPRLPRRWLATGGGRHNPVLMARIAAAVAAPVEPVEAVGWDGDALEAQAFAFLAVRSLARLPLSLPTTTGVPQPLTGGVLHRAA